MPIEPEVSITVGAGYTLAQHDVSNILSVKVNPSQTDLPVYIDATLSNGKLVIKTNAQFVEYEKLDDKLFFINRVVFTCTSGTVLEMLFRQPIKEENNHAPLFSKSSYDITIPLPLPRDFNIQQFIDGGNGVVANDYDLTKNKITFSIDENDYFIVQSMTGSSRTETIANLVTKQTLTKIQPPITVQITAMDEWNPPKTSTATITIAGDPVISFVTPPDFEQNLYQAAFKLGDNFTPIRMSLQPNTYDTTVRYEASGADVDYFTITPATDRSSVTVTLRSGTQIDAEKKLLSLTITASRTGTENVGRAALVVELSHEPKIVPAFEASLYTGTIDRNKVINVETIKLLSTTTDSSVRVQLSGEDSQYFTLSFANNQATLVPSNMLSDSVLKEKHFFLVTLQAEKPGVGTGEALVVLTVEKSDSKEPHFEQTVYEGTITEIGALNVPLVRIAPDSLVPGLEYDYTGDTTLVTATSDSSGTITIASNNITPEKLTDKSYILLSIVVKLEGEETAHTVVILKVLRTPIVLPKFTEPLLEGELILSTLEVRLPKVELVQETFTADTKVSVIDDRYFFDIVEDFPENVFKVSLRLNVTREMLREIDRFSLRVEATNPNSEKAYCFVTIEVSRAAPPTFERLIYDGVIDESKQLVQEIVAKLTADSAGERITFTLEGEDASFFSIKNEAPTWDNVRIGLKSPLSDAELESRDYFQLNLKATNTLLAADTVVPLVVYVKRSLVKIPKFEKQLYKSRIGTDLKLVPFEQIKLEPGSYLEMATVAIRHSNSEFFGVQLLEGGTVMILLLKELDAASVNGVSRFEFVIECINPEMASGYTTILVDIDRVIAPEFTDRFYIGEVREDAKEITFDKAVTLKPQTIVGDTVYGLEGADSTLVRYVVLSDQRLSFFLRDEVTKEQLKARSEMAFIIVASNPGNSQPAVVSCSVKIVREVKPTFTRTSFRGKIVEGKTVVDFGSTPIAWETDSVEDTATFTIVDAVPNSFFDVKLAENGNTVNIVLKSDVVWDQVRASSYYQFILQAANPGSDVAQCTVVIDVENLPTITPTFTKPIYRGSLQEGTKEVQFSAADTITVQPETIMSSFQYAAVDGDSSLFDVVLLDGNKFKVSLKDSIAPGSIEGRDMLSFIITIRNAYSADDTATIVITIKLDDIIMPTFSKLLYDGSIVEGTNVLRLQESILLSGGTFTENTEIGVGGTDAALFTASRVGAELNLRIQEDAFDWNALVAKQYLTIYVQATNPGSETATSFVVIAIERLRQPQFVQSSTHGYIEAGDRDVRFAEGSELRIVTDSTEPGYQWNLAGDDYQLFDGSLVEDSFKFSLKESIDEEQRTRTVFSFKVILKNPNGRTIDSTVVVNRRLFVPQFSKNIYTGSFNPDLQLMLADAIEITQASFTSGIMVTILESNVDFLTLEQSGRSVELKLSRSVSTSDFQGLEAVRVVLLAKVTEDSWSTCSVTLAVPEGTPCIPLPPIVDCSSCYNCTTGSIQEDVPVFPYGNFRFQLRSDTTGIIGTVTATVKDSTSVVQHTLDVDDAYLKAKLSITPEGRLMLASPVIPNVYQFVVHATNTAAGKQATANVWLDVLNQFECTEGDRQVAVDQVLFVEHLDEERPHTTIFSTQLSESCTYELISEHPTAADQQEPYFYIDPQTSWLAARSFDRENEKLFEHMSIPQFKLVLKLKCLDNDEAGDENSQRSRVKRSLVETGTINYAPDITIVNIIVNDINDNDPVFVKPEAISENRIWLGFPEPSLANRLMLSGLTAVVATDADADLNAKIRYSVAENEHFTIHPETGSIKPTKDALRVSNLVDLTVYATDRDGAIDGRSSRLEIAVHRLHENQIAFVILDAADEATVQGIIEQINRQSNFHLKLLHQTNVPELKMSGDRANLVEEAIRPVQDMTGTMRIVVYALNDNNQLLSTEDIRSGITAVFPSIKASAIESFSDAVCFDTETNPSCPEELSGGSSNSGLIASTSVLGGLLLICMAITIVLYLRYVRPLSKGADNNPSDIVELENDFDTTPPSASPSLGAKKERNADDPEIVDDRKISINIAGITMQESEDTNVDAGNRLARSLTERLNEEDEYGAINSGSSGQETFSEPKNVKFNEVVERIEVQEHHSDEDDGSSVYEERL
uniref:Cadherin domain-containing protein n=1 Tax=Anopheles christyi TaxID=43041 RepID=A0A182K2B1_9DIPT